LPNIKRGISISKGQYNKSRINADNAFYILGLLLDEVGMGWLVGGVTNLAFPII